MNLNYFYQNNMINLVASAASECYNTDISKKDNIERAAYIGRLVKSGHESVLEHSNTIIRIYLKYDDLEYYIKMTAMDLFKYLNHNLFRKDNDYELVIGGNIRGFKYIFRNIPYDDYNNPIIIEIKSYLENYIDCNFYIDFIEDEIFTNYEPISNDDDINKVVYEDKDLGFKILNIDPIAEITNILDIDHDYLMDYCTITIEFTKVSRIISQQYCRHEAGITQESQRYVNYSNSVFNSPVKYKSDEYDDKKLYTINIAGNIYEFTLQELGDTLVKIYPQLVEQGLKKEDARAYLPNNVQTKFVQTYTFRNFINFLKLRVDEHSQAEIRLMAKGLEKFFIDWIHENLYEKLDIYTYLEPVYKSYISNENDNDEYYVNIDEEL